MTRLRVLRISNAGGYGRQQMGGAERGLRQQAPALGREFELVVGLPAGELMAQLRADGVTVHDVGPRRRIDLTYVRDLARLMREFRPDVIHLQLLSASTHGRVAAALSRTQAHVVVSLHNDLAETARAASSRRQKLKGGIDAAIERVCDLICESTHVAVGEPEADALRRTFRYSKVRLIPNELPMNWVRPSDQQRLQERARLGFFPEDFVVGAFMRLEESKGVDVLWTAIEQTSNPWLVCGSGTSPPDIGRERRLVHLEYQPHVLPLMSACDAVVVPSRVESFGRTAVEALAIGVPVVHSGAGGLPWVTRDVSKDFARTYSSNDPAALVQQLRSLEVEIRTGRLEPERNDAMTVIGSRFAFDVGIAGWRDLYRTLAGSE